MKIRNNTFKRIVAVLGVIFIVSISNVVAVNLVSSIEIQQNTEQMPYCTKVATSPENTISLDAGIYEMKLNVWIDPASQLSKFYTCIEDPWIVSEWDLSGVVKGEWIELIRELNLSSEVVNSGFQIQVPNNPEYGSGKGIFYIDDISWVKKTASSAHSIFGFQFKVYPNPANDIIKVEAPSGSDVFIYNALGLLVHISKNVSGIVLVPIRNLSDGIYFVKICKTGIAVEKFLKISK